MTIYKNDCLKIALENYFHFKVRKPEVLYLSDNLPISISFKTDNNHVRLLFSDIIINYRHYLLPKHTSPKAGIPQRGVSFDFLSISQYSLYHLKPC